MSGAMAGVYRIRPRGRVPADLTQRISRLHAQAILHRPCSAYADDSLEPPEVLDLQQEPAQELQADGAEQQ